MKTRKAISGLFVALAMLGWQSASAQFAGDVFFIEPSVAIPAGEQKRVEVAAFAGAATFGAAQFDLLFNPAELEIIAVHPGDSPELQEGFSYRHDNGKVSIIAVNGASHTSPIGTVSLGFIEVRPLAPAGSIVRIRANVQAMLQQDSTAFAASNGFGLDIAVTSPEAGNLTNRQANATAQPGVTGDIVQRALELRPKGSTVTMMVLNENNYAIPVTVSTAEPGAAKE